MTEHMIPQNNKHFWSYIRNLNRKSGLPAEMTYGDKKLQTSQDIADAFAEHFQSVYSNFDVVDVSRTEAVDFSTTLSFHNFELQEIIEKLNHLDVSKAAGPDGIPAVFLKSCSSSLALPLQMIFQRSLNTGQFPKIWKVSRQQPIFKSGDRSDIANYRGISIISAIPKLFEAILTDEIC